MGDLKNRVELVVCRRLRRQHGAGAAPAELADPVDSILTRSASEEQGGSAGSRRSDTRRPPRTDLRGAKGSNDKKNGSALAVQGRSRVQQSLGLRASRRERDSQAVRQVDAGPARACRAVAEPR